MKKAILLISIISLFASCGPSKEELIYKQQNRLRVIDGYNIIIIDKCEYIRLTSSHGEILTHKGDCTHHNTR